MENFIPTNTPLVELKEIEKYFGFAGKIYAKVEYFNPSGSVKDRPVYQMLLDYKEAGILKEGGTIVEATSGNTGIALAFYSKIFKYRLIIVMPKSMSEQRRKMITDLGGELCLVDGGMSLAKETAENIVKETPNSFIFNQFNNDSNPKAHYLNTAPEIFSKLDKVGYFFAGFGTGGTISGIGQYAKEHKLSTKIVAIEPEESPLITKGVAGKHKIQGIGANFVPYTLKKEFIDEFITANSDKSIVFARLVRDLEKLDIGISSGAALLGAINYIKEHNIKEGTVVVLFPDKGDRYTW